MRSGKELCPPELLDSMARYTKIVLLAGPPMMSTGGTGALTASFTTSIHIATAPTHLLVGTDESYSLLPGTGAGSWSSAAFSFQVHLSPGSN